MAERDHPSPLNRRVAYHRAVLTKDLLRVTRRGGGYRPLFADGETDLAARVVGTFQGHVGSPRADLEDALTALEREAEDYKLVRGLAHLAERDATFETRAPVEPERARKAAFAAAEPAGVVTEAEREAALAAAADALGEDPAAVGESLFADLSDRQVLATFDPRWSPAELVAQYDLSLAQTALFDATEVRVRTSDPRALVSAVKRLGLLYEIRRGDGDAGGDGADAESGSAVRTETDEDDPGPATLSEREIVVTGPDALFRRSRRYGTRFARLLRTVASAGAWRLEATVDDRGTERELVLDDADPVRVPGTEPVGEVSYDSGVEADFAARFTALDLDWTLRREPEPLATGARVMIPDFAFDYRHADFRVFFEIMGFWTPEYVDKKLSQLASVEDVEMLVAVDEDLGVGEDVEDLDHRAIPYSGRVRVKDVRDALRRYEQELVAETAADLPEELRPDADAVPLADVAADRGVSEAALDAVAFPDHRLVGRTLVRPGVLADLADDLEAGMTLDAAESVLAERGLAETSAALSALGYRVEWDGLDGGRLREVEE